MNDHGTRLRTLSPVRADTVAAPPGSAERNTDKGNLRILVVDDEKLIADTLTHILNRSGFTAVAAHSSAAALVLAPSLCPDILLTDVQMPGRNGIETAVLIREQFAELRVILLSGQTRSGEMSEAGQQQLNGFELWRKPIHPRELLRRLRAL